MGATEVAGRVRGTVVTTFQAASASDETVQSDWFAGFERFGNRCVGEPLWGNRCGAAQEPQRP